MQVFITVVVGLLSAADRSSLTRAPLHTITTIEGQTCSNASNGTRVYTIVLLSKHSNQRTQHSTDVAYGWICGKQQCVTEESVILRLSENIENVPQPVNLPLDNASSVRGDENKERFVFNFHNCSVNIMNK
jgi:hypothetical protein